MQHPAASRQLVGSMIRRPRSKKARNKDCQNRGASSHHRGQWQVLGNNSCESCRAVFRGGNASRSTREDQRREGIHVPVREARAGRVSEGGLVVHCVLTEHARGTPSGHAGFAQRKVFTTPPQTKRTASELRVIVPKPWPVAKEPRCVRRASA